MQTNANWVKREGGLSVNAGWQAMGNNGNARPPPLKPDLPIESTHRSARWKLLL